MTCQICNKESGEYSLCPECFELMQKGEIKQCANCKGWYKVGSVCKCIKNLNKTKSSQNKPLPLENDYSKKTIKGFLIALAIIATVVVAFLIIKYLTGWVEPSPGTGGCTSGSGVK